MSEPIHPLFLKAAQEGEIPKGQVLLIGTRGGAEAVYLLERGYDVVGIDTDIVQTRATREVVSTHGFFGFFQTGTPEAIPVEDHYFDVVIDFLGAPETEIKRVLQPKGISLKLK